MASYIEVFASGSAMISLPAKSRLARKDVVASGFVVKPGSILRLDKELLFGNDSLIAALVREQNNGHIQVREDNMLLSTSDLNAYSSAGLAAAYNFLRNYVQSGLVFAVGTTPSVVAGPCNTDITAGRALLDTLPTDFVAAVDWNYLANGIDYAGAAAVAIADTMSVEVAFVLYTDTSGPTMTLIAIFGDEVLTGTEVIPSDTQIDEALKAGGANYGGKFLRIAEVNLARAGAVLTETWRGGEGALAAYFNRAPSA